MRDVGVRPGFGNVLNWFITNGWRLTTSLRHAACSERNGAQGEVRGGGSTTLRFRQRGALGDTTIDANNKCLPAICGVTAQQRLPRVVALRPAGATGAAPHR
jgi:hypothetical protein